MQNNERAQLLTLQLILALREQAHTKVPLIFLLERLGLKSFPGNTIGWLFAESIGILNNIGIIEISDQNDKIIESGMHNDLITTFDEGYWSLGDFFKKNAINIFFALTTKLEYLQSTLNISITKLYSELKNPEQLAIVPFFEKPLEKKIIDIFVLMPFKDELKYIYNNHIKRVCNNLNFTSERADNLLGSHQIMKDVWSLIYNSKIVIADCTDKNPNVFYELGIAHTLGKKVIVLTQNVNDIPFDIQHLRYILYDCKPDGIQNLEQTLLTIRIEMQTLFIVTLLSQITIQFLKLVA